MNAYQDVTREKRNGKNFQNVFAFVHQTNPAFILTLFVDLRVFCGRPGRFVSLRQLGRRLLQTPQLQVMFLHLTPFQLSFSLPCPPFPSKRFHPRLYPSCLLLFSFYHSSISHPILPLVFFFFGLSSPSYSFRPCIHSSFFTHLLQTDMPSLKANEWKFIEILEWGKVLWIGASAQC